MSSSTLTLYHDNGLYSGKTTLDKNSLIERAERESNKSAVRALFNKVCHMLIGKLCGLNEMSLAQSIKTLNSSSSADDCDVAFDSLKEDLKNVRDCSFEKKFIAPVSNGNGDWTITYTMKVGAEDVELRKCSCTLSKNQKQQFIKERVDEQLKVLDSSFSYKSALRKALKGPNLTPEKFKAHLQRLNEQSDGKFKFSCTQYMREPHHIAVSASVLTEVGDVSEVLFETYLYSADDFKNYEELDQQLNRFRKQKNEKKRNARYKNAVRDGWVRADHQHN